MNRKRTPDSLTVGDLAVGSFELLHRKFQIIPESKGEDCSASVDVVGSLHIDGHLFAIRCEACAEDHLLEERINAFEDLTPREREIALLVSRGRLNKQIADQLRISEHTVASHLRRIFSKMRVRTRAAMVYCFACSLKADLPAARSEKEG